VPIFITVWIACLNALVGLARLVISMVTVTGAGMEAGYVPARIRPLTDISSGKRAMIVEKASLGRIAFTSALAAGRRHVLVVGPARTGYVAVACASATTQTPWGTGPAAALAQIVCLVIGAQIVGVCAQASTERRFAADMVDAVMALMASVNVSVLCHTLELHVKQNAQRNSSTKSLEHVN